jgi:hypothetical protein
MKISQILRLGIFLALFIAFAGCSGVPVKFTTEPNQPYDATKGRSVTSKACGFQLLLVIPISINDRADRAYADLVNEANGDYLTSIKVQEKWYYAFVGTMYCTEMQAMAYPKKAAISTLPTTSTTPSETTSK